MKLYIRQLLVLNQIFSALSINVTKFYYTNHDPWSVTVANLISFYQEEYAFNIYIDKFTAQVANQFLNIYPTVNIISNCETNQNKEFIRSSSRSKHLNIIAFSNRTCFKKYLTGEIVTSQDVLLFLAGSSIKYLMIDYKRYLNKLSKAGQILILNLQETSILYSMCFFCGNNSGTFVSRQEISLGGFVKKEPYLLINNYSNFNGHIVKVGYINAFPDVYCLKRIASVRSVVCRKAVGIEINLLNIISETLNFKVQLIEAENQSYDALVVGLESNQYDLAIGGLTMTEKRRKRYQFSDVQKFEELVIVVHYQKSFFAKLTDFDPISASNRLFGFFVAILLALIIYFIRRYFAKSPESFSLISENLLFVLGDHALTLTKIIPKKFNNTIKIIITSYFLYTLISNTMVKSTITASMMENHPLELTLEQLIEEDYEVIIDSAFENDLAFYQKQIEIRTKIFTSNFCNSFNFIMKNKAAIVGEASKCFYDIAQDCGDDLLSNNFKGVTAHSFGVVPFAWIFRQHIPFISAFNLQIQKIRSDIYLTKSNSLDDMEFVLPKNANVFIKITDIDQTVDVFNPQVEVTSAITDSSQSFKIANQITNLIKVNKLSEAVQVANALTEEIKDSPNQLKKILELFEDLKLTSNTELSLASFISRLVYNMSRESDPKQGVLSTNICKQAAKNSLDNLEQEPFPKIFTENVKEIAVILMKCGDTDVQERELHLNLSSLPLILTTPYPQITYKVLEENYPDYIIDYGYLDDIQQYTKTAKNYVDIYESNLNSLILTIAEGEESVSMTTETSNCTIQRLPGYELADKKIAFGHGSLLQLSRDLQQFEDGLDLRLCSWQHNPFWWSKFEIISNVVLLQIKQNEKKLTTFKNQFLLSLKVDYNKTRMKNHKIEINDLTVVRVDVRKGESFNVEFHNVTTSFRVLITNFVKPEIEEVTKNGEIITKDANVLFQHNNLDYDSWFYVSIPKSPQNLLVSVYSLSCMVWNVSNKQWTFGCLENYELTSTTIICECLHLSILGAAVYDNEIKIDTPLLELKTKMELISSPIIFISLAVIIMIFCVLLAIVVRKRKIHMPEVYLPPDVSTKMRYAYLVRICTGAYPSSGTTSLICLQIFGTDSRSSKHVLNYPDPDWKLLRRNRDDWFTIPTTNFLGEIKEIELWTNYSGRYPTWYCGTVTVFDLQVNKTWYFDVNTWFGLDKNQVVFFKGTLKQHMKSVKIQLRLWPRRDFQSRFSNLLKLLLVVSVTLTVFIACLQLYKIPTLRLTDVFSDKSEFTIDLELVVKGIAAAFISFCVHVPLMCFLNFKSSREFINFSQNFLIAHSILSVGILITFGFWLPQVVGFYWISSVCIAILVYFFIFEQVYDIVYMTFGLRKKDKESFPNLMQYLDSIEEQRKILFHRYGKALLRPFLTHLYSPLTDEDIEEKRIKKETRRKFIDIVEDIVMILSYVILLYLTVFASKNRLSIYNYDELLALISGHHTHSQHYSEISSVHEFYDYLETTLIPNLHSAQWYGKFVLADPGTMSDYNNKVLGVVRLRQKRISIEPCPDTPIIVLTKNTICRPEFWLGLENFTNLKPQSSSNLRLNSIWEYISVKNAGFSLVSGKFGVYSGGGYIAPLGRTLFNSHANCDYFKRSQWLDLSTAVILVEFLSYNVNSNLFNAVRLLCEKSATGYFMLKTDVETVQLLYVNNEEANLQTIIFLVFALIMVAFTFKVTLLILRKRLLVLQDLWIVVDLLIIGLSYGNFGFSLYRTKLVKDYLEKIKETRNNESTNYFHLTQTETTIMVVAAFLIFISTIRLWKLCRVGKVFKIMEKTLRLALIPMLGLICCHVLIILSFSLSGHVIFGKDLHEFKDFGDTIISVMLLTNSLHIYFEPSTLLRAHSILGPIYYAALMILSLLITNIYVAVIIISYYRARDLLAKTDDFGKFSSFVFEEYRQCKMSFKIYSRRMRGGAHNKVNLLSPKLVEYRYVDAKPMPSKDLDLMACFALNELIQFGLYDSGKRSILMRKIALIVLKGGEDADIFFIGKNKKQIIKVIHDNKILKIAKAAKLILLSDEKMTNKKKVQYKRIMDRNLQKLNRIFQVLAKCSDVISNIDSE